MSSKTDNSENLSLERIDARMAIAEMAHCYAFAIDVLGNSPPSPAGKAAGLARASSMLAECMAADAQVYLYLDGPDGKADAMGAGGPEDFAKAVRTYFDAYAYVGTQHVVGNIRVAFVDDGRANVTSYIPALHWLSDGRMLLTPVLYEDEVVRDGPLWKISVRKIIALRFWVTEGYKPAPGDPTMSRDMDGK